MSKKIMFICLFVGVLSFSCFAMEAVKNANDIKESESKFKKLKKLMLCIKQKDGCSKKQIAAIAATITVLALLITGGGFEGYQWYQKWKKKRSSRLKDEISRAKIKAGDPGFKIKASTSFR